MSVCPSVRTYIHHTFIFLIPATVSLYVTNESCLVCVKKEKYTFLVTPTLIRSMRRGKAKLRTFHNQVRRSQATYIKVHFSVSLPPQCQSQAVVCVSKPRMYPRSGYFLALKQNQIEYFFQSYADGIDVTMLGDANLKK